MSIYLEQFSILKSPKQGFDIHRLVNEQRTWLETRQPTTVERYHDLPHAIKNVASLATHEGLQAYIVRQQKHSVARGLATMIFDRGVIHPVEGRRYGTDLDYWLDESARGDEDLHDSVARGLMRASKARAIKNYPKRFPDRDMPSGFFDILIAPPQINQPPLTPGLQAVIPAFG